MNAPTSTLTLLHASTPAGVALADAVTRSLARSPSWYELHRAPLEELAERPWPAEAPAEPDEPRRGLHGNLLLDTDLGLSVRALLRMDTSERARTSVVTDLQHPLALDVLASRHIAHVASLEAVDESATTSARLLHVALTGMFEQRGYQWASGATYMMLRVVSLLATGLDAAGIAHELCLSVKTVQAHLANVRGQFALETDHDLLAAINARGDLAPTSGLGRAPLLLLRATHEDALAFVLALNNDLLAPLAALERVHAFGCASGVTSLSVSVPLDGHARLHADRRAHRYWPTTISNEASERHYALRERPDKEGLITLDAKDLPEGFDEIAASERVELVLDNSGGHFTLEMGSVAKRVSGPLLDRFDLRERMARVPTDSVADRRATSARRLRHGHRSRSPRAVTRGRSRTGPTRFSPSRRPSVDEEPGL